MEFCILTKEEFNTYSQNHTLSNFHQSSYWAEVKRSNGWISEFVGIKENGEICGATLLLSKKIARFFKLYYSPRGFLVDYYDDEKLNYLTKQVIQHIKKNKGILLKIDPSLDEKELDIDGQPVESGYDHTCIKEKLQRLGFKYLVGKNGKAETTMIHTIFLLDFDGRSNDELLASFSKQTQRHIKTAIKNGIVVEDLSYNDLHRFQEMMDRTGNRRGFINRPLAYFQEMYNAFAKEGHMTYRMAKLNIVSYKEQMQQRYDTTLQSYQRVMKKKEANPETTKFDGEIKNLQTSLDAAKKALLEAEELHKQYGEFVDISCACYFKWGKEVLYYFAGNEEELLKYGGQYMIHWNMLQEANNEGYSRYNFYGITNNIVKDDPGYGVYLTKRGFNGRVAVLLGEFDYIVNPLMYRLYLLALATYNIIRKK